MNPVVSIIIPTYNRAHLIGETLDSVLAQTFKFWECIVVDDGSTDHTEELLQFYCEKDSRIKFYYRPKDRPKGANACRNYGLKESRGKYVNWFDSDDLMDSEKLSIQVERLEQSNYNFTVCQTVVFKTNLSYILGLRHEEIFSANTFEDYLCEKIGWLTQAPLWNKSFLVQNNFKFDETLLAAQEWEFHCRVLIVSSNYDWIDQPLVYIRQHNDSISYEPKNENLREWYYFLARLKIYRKQRLRLPGDVKDYLQLFLLHKFKSFVRKKSLKKSVVAFFYFIVREKELTLISKISGFLAIFSFALFGRGHIFTKKVKFGYKSILL